MDGGKTADGGERAEGARTTLNRRQVLKVLGAVPVAAVAGPGAAAHKVHDIATQTTAPAQAAAPKFFNAHEWRTVRMLVDYVIPRDERSGSATDAKVPEYIDYLLAEKDASLNMQTAWRGGLAWIDTEAHKRYGRTFIQATDAQRRQILDDIAYPDKAKPEQRYGVAFFNRLRDMTASGFFSSAMGWQDVQYIGNVFNPGYDGCPPAALEKLGVSYDVMQTRVSPQSK